MDNNRGFVLGFSQVVQFIVLWSSNNNQISPFFIPLLAAQELLSAATEDLEISDQKEPAIPERRSRRRAPPPSSQSPPQRAVV